MSTQSPGGREVAHRIFATEFSDASYSFSRGDEERAPNYVVSPTGAMINRLFVVGVLTEVEQVNDETVRARIADPTGVFVVYASQYQPDARADFQELEPPEFVAITGKANTFVPDGSEQTFTSIRPEAVAAVDAETRDHWTVTTAEHTLARLGDLAAARTADGEEGDGVRMALDEYDPSPAYIASLYRSSVEALEMVAGERDAVEETPELGMTGEADPSLAEIVDVGQAMAIDLPRVHAGSTDADQRDSTDQEEPATAEVDEQPPQSPPPEPPSDPDEPVVSSDEREAIETEFGTEFATGDEIDPPAAETDEPESTPEDTSAVSPTDEAVDESDEPDLSDRLMTLLTELDEGDGVPRGRLIELGSERFDADPEDVDDALRTAMMDGKCYEPAEDVLRPI